MKPQLQFRADRTFTIVQFTDVHWKNGCDKDDRTSRLMEAVLEAERPDLVVFTGDVIEANDCDDPRRSFRNAVIPVERARIPWALAFGNHDTESGISRSELMEVAQEHRYALAESGPADIDGVGNYLLPIRNEGGAVTALLYFFDSGNRSPLPHVEGYDWIRHSQIGWYRAQSAALTRENGGRPHSALAFLHIPLPEYASVWEHEDSCGHKNEPVCCPRLNSGLLAAMAEMGDVAGVFAGHDHTNDYMGESAGIKLAYGRATGYNTYGLEGFRRGARIIRLREGERGFDTWIRQEDGTAERAEPGSKAGAFA